MAQSLIGNWSNPIGIASKIRGPKKIAAFWRGITLMEQPVGKYQPSSRLRIVVIVIAIVSLLGLIALYVVGSFVVQGEPLHPPTPPLLRNVSAGGGSAFECPEDEKKNGGTPLALSPELDQRLAQRFPPGSPEDQLVTLLIDQGFRVEPSPCRQDRSIGMASFSQHGGGFFGPYPMGANIFWKFDRSKRLVWTKGFVEYTGP